MTRSNHHAGLVFRAGLVPDASQVAGFAACALSEQGCPADAFARRLPGTAILKSPCMTLRIRLQPAGDDTRVVLTLEPGAIPAPSGRAPDLLLLILLYGLAETFAPRQVEWLDPSARIDTPTFLSLFDGVVPPVPASAPRPGESRTYAETPPPPMPEAEAPQPRPRAPRNDLQRLTAWAMTGCIATLSLPVAASLAAVNLIRGEDFRLNTQVLSMTVLVASVPAYGLF